MEKLNRKINGTKPEPIAGRAFMADIYFLLCHRLERYIYVLSDLNKKSFFAAPCIRLQTGEGFQSKKR
jgi:hypothetical protein